MMKRTLLHIIIFFPILALAQESAVLKNDNYVKLSYSIKKRSFSSVCQSQNNSNNKRMVYLWEVKVYLKNKSNKTLILKNGNVKIDPVDKPSSCFPHFKELNGVFHHTSPFMYFPSGLSSNRLKPYETYTNTVTYYLDQAQSPKLIKWTWNGYLVKDGEKKEKETDDFWSGKKETKKSNSSSNANKDDFWSGGQSKSKTTQTKQSDFWTGKGSQKEEDYFKTHTKPKKSNQFIGEINSKTKYIKIVCRDHGTEDGDRVALLNNKELVESDIYLTNSPKPFRIQLQWGMNRIDFKALNQGSMGPNTAEFDVYDDTGKLISSKEWHLLTGFTGTLLITKF